MEAQKVRKNAFSRPSDHRESFTHKTGLNLEIDEDEMNFVARELSPVIEAKDDVMFEEYAVHVCHASF